MSLHHGTVDIIGDKMKIYKFPQGQFGISLWERFKMFLRRVFFRKNKIYSYAPEFNSKSCSYTIENDGWVTFNIEFDLEDK